MLPKQEKKWNLRFLIIKENSLKGGFHFTIEILLAKDSNIL